MRNFGPTGDQITPTLGQCSVLRLNVCLLLRDLGLIVHAGRLSTACLRECRLDPVRSGTGRSGCFFRSSRTTFSNSLGPSRALCGHSSPR